MRKTPRGKNYLALQDPTDTLDLGRTVADSDGNLAQYYVGQENYLKRALDPNDPAVFFIGPKGAGKSAVLQMVRLQRHADAERVIDISPDDLALSTITDAETTSPIIADASHNQYIFKSLWDYVLAVEIFRREYKETGSLFNYFLTLFRNRHQKLARRLVDMSCDETHPTFTSRILQLIDELQIGYEANGFSAKATLKPNERTADCSPTQLLNLVTQVAKAIPKSLRHTYYILIDDLDRYWKDTPTQNAFIAALFSSLRHFSRSDNIKASVALREVIYRHLPLDDRDKLHDMIVNLKWGHDAVKQMITKRAVFKFKTTEPEVWGKLFPENAFEEIWGRSNGRPREAIRAATLAVQAAAHNGHHSVSETDFSEAMLEFSNERINEVCDEVKHQYPGLQFIVRRMNGWPKEFPFKRVEEFLNYLVLEVGCNEPGSDKFAWVSNFEENAIGFVHALASEAGVLWIKRSQGDPARPFDPSDHIEISQMTWFAIHPMFTLGLGVKGA